VATEGVAQKIVANLSSTEAENKKAMKIHGLVVWLLAERVTANYKFSNVQ